jgi:hypothetical protein
MFYFTYPHTVENIKRFLILNGLVYIGLVITKFEEWLIIYNKQRVVPVQAWAGSDGCRRLSLPELITSGS